MIEKTQKLKNSKTQDVELLEYLLLI